jgi:hypothetical protein
MTHGKKILLIFLLACAVLIVSTKLDDQLFSSAKVALGLYSIAAICVLAFWFSLVRLIWHAGTHLSGK